MLVETDDIKKLVADAVEAALTAREKATAKPPTTTPADPDPIAIARALDDEIARMSPAEYARRRASGWKPGDASPAAK